MAQPLRLSIDGIEIDDPAAPTRAQNRAALPVRVLVVGLAVVLAVGAVIAIVVAIRGSGNKTQCTIANCNRTSAANWDCSEAVCESCNSGWTVSQDTQGSYCSLDCAGKLDFCAKFKVAPRYATTCEQVGCQECAQGAEAFWNNRTLLPTVMCRFKCTDQQIAKGCAPGFCTNDKTCSKCRPGFEQRPIANCNRTSFPDRSCSKAVCDSCDFGWTVSQDAEGSYCGLDCAGKLAFCAEPKVAPRNATGCEQVGCQECAEGAEPVLDRQTLLPADKCRFTCTSQLIQKGCAQGFCTDAKTCSKCAPGFVQQSAGSCQRASSNVMMTFFMYMAQSDVSFPPENVNLASASGVMWYLHNEVMGNGCTPPPGDSSGRLQRQNGITRVIRYGVTVYNTPEVYGNRLGQFGPFYTFDKGQCTNMDCESWWTNYGYTVGCQPLYSALHDNYPDGALYSLPGRCPSLQFSDPQRANCNGQQPGGQCEQPNGTSTCTWSAEEVDSISVDKFCDIAKYQAFCDSGKREYSQTSDKGFGCSFWDDKNNITRNSERVLRMEQFFAAQTPGLHSWAMPEPLCDGF